MGLKDIQRARQETGGLDPAAEIIIDAAKSIIEKYSPSRIVDPSRLLQDPSTLYIDCCGPVKCWSCGHEYYGDSRSRAEHKCYTCRKEKRPYNPDISPINSMEIEELK